MEIKVSDIEQKAKAGDGSTVIQGGNIVIHHGMNERDVKELAVRIFEDNMPRLEQAAKETAMRRANELVSEIIIRVGKDQNYKKFERLSTPRKQNDFINAQKAYAFSDGNDILREMLSCLVEKSLAEEEEQSLASVVASVAILAVSSLTREQLMILALRYYLDEISLLKCSTAESFFKYIEEHLEKLNVFDLADAKEADYVHLEAMNCVAINFSKGRGLSGTLLNKYAGFFSNGLSEDEVQTAFADAGCDVIAMVDSLHRAGLKQVGFLYENQIVDAVKKGSISEAQGGVLTSLIKKSLMKDSQVKEIISSSSDKLTQVASALDESLMYRIRLTTVGKAIGYNIVTNKLNAKHISLSF